MKRVIPIVLVVIVIAVALGVAFIPRPASQPETVVSANQSTARPVRVESVKEQDLKETLSFHGTVAPHAQVMVVPKTSGRVAAVNVEVGDRVAEGDLLIELEAREAQLQAQQALAQVQVAKANVAKIKAGALPEEVEQAEASLEQARANYEQARLSYERSRRLHEQGVLSTQEWDGISAQYQVAKAQLVTAEKSLELINQGARPEDLLSAEASLKQAEAAWQLAELQVEYAQITAPIDGYVTQVSTEKGSMASTGNPVAVIVETSVVKLPLQVSARDVVRLRRSQSAELTVDVLPGVKVDGKISSVSPAADQSSGLFPVTAEFDNPDGLLRPGMYASIRIPVSERTQVLTVPSRAVVTENGVEGVYVVKDGVARFTPIQKGLAVDSRVEVESGLSVGELVVVTGQSSLGDGMSVTIIEGGSN